MTDPFRVVSYPTRLFAGVDAVDQMGAETKRLGCSRAFVISGRSTGADTANRARIEAALGPALAGWYAGTEKDSTYCSVAEATVQARAAGADMVVAVGDGSVTVAGRAVAIFLAEPGDPFEIMTQYPYGKPSYSPRLETPKPPIINVVTTPTTAMNRAGTGLKNDDLDYRMEYFDPKTRPASIVWDEALLMATPVEVFRSAATTMFGGAVMGVGSLSGNPLVDGDRLQSFRLATSAYSQLGTPEDTPAVRLDLMTVAYLANRIADVTVTGPRQASAPAGWGRGYALATALHLRYHHLGQGEATAIINPTILMRYPPPAATLRPVADGLGLALAAEADAETLAAAIAKEMRRICGAAGIPARLRDVDVPQAELPLVAAETQKNFNANPGERDPNEVREMVAILQAE